MPRHSAVARNRPAQGEATPFAEAPPASPPGPRTSGTGQRVAGAFVATLVGFAVLVAELRRRCALLADVVDRLPEVQLVVASRDRARIADRDHLALVEQHGTVAEALDRVHVVGHEEDRAALALEALELVEALLLEAPEE